MPKKDDREKRDNKRIYEESKKWRPRPKSHAEIMDKVRWMEGELKKAKDARAAEDKKAAERKRVADAKAAERKRLSAARRRGWLKEEAKRKAKIQQRKKGEVPLHRGKAPRGKP